MLASDNVGFVAATLFIVNAAALDLAVACHEALCEKHAAGTERCVIVKCFGSGSGLVRFLCESHIYL